MDVPDSRNLHFVRGILPEATGDDRLVIWVPIGTDRNGWLWERVGSIARAEVVAGDYLCSVAATSVPARQKSGGLLGRLLGLIRSSPSDRALALPDGRLVEPCGKRRSDLLLAWAANGSSPVDDAQVRAHWPGCESVRRLGENLFLVSGVAPREKGVPSPAPAAPASLPAPTPKSLAEYALAIAIEAGDRRGEVVALSDLGFIALADGDARGAAIELKKALALARQAGDRPRVAELLGHLGLAETHLGRNTRAIELMEQGLAEARAANDPFAEKLLLERRGQVESNLKDAGRALVSYEQALAITQRVGDHHQEGFLLWRIGAIHAGRGDRDTAIARCSEAINLFRKLGRPHAAWFAQHLDRYRSDVSVGLAVPASASWVATSGAGALATQDTATTAGSGPGILQMAVSASKAMAKFIGSGMKSASPEIRDWRLAICRGCEHHTGIRCRVCGCFTDVKARLGGEACPIGKW